MRGPVFASRSRSSPALRSTSSHCSVSTSVSRHPVTISSRSAAAARALSALWASSSHSARPTRRYSSSLRNRSRILCRYCFTNRHGLPPGGAIPQSSASANIFDNTPSARFAARGVARSE